MLASIGLITLGIGAGIVMYHFFILSKHGGKSLSNQLSELKKEHQQYQYNVAEHFQQTTEMLETLNEQYEKVQLHIQSGAELLTQHEHVSLDQVSNHEQEISDEPLLQEQDEVESTKPKDYA